MFGKDRLNPQLADLFTHRCWLDTGVFEATQIVPPMPWLTGDTERGFARAAHTVGDMLFCQVEKLKIKGNRLHTGIVQMIGRDLFESAFD